MVKKTFAVEVTFKAWFAIKSLVLLKLLVCTSELLFLYCMCLINSIDVSSERKVNTIINCSYVIKKK